MESSSHKYSRYRPLDVVEVREKVRNYFIGKKETEVVEMLIMHKCDYRYDMIDGEPQPLPRTRTTIRQRYRINLTVEDEVVTNVRLG